MWKQILTNRDVPKSLPFPIERKISIGYFSVAVCANPVLIGNRLKTARGL
jgi:hypothetical protein